MGRSLIRSLRRLCLCAAAALAPAAPPAAAHPIVNIASAEWDAGGVHQLVRSNQVTLSPEAQPASVALLQMGSARAARATSLPAGGSCRLPSGGAAPALARGAFAALAGSAALVPADAIHRGEPLVLAVTAPARNLDPARPDHFLATARTAEGDSETLEFIETAADSGLFTAAIATRASPPPFTSGDCTFSLPREAVRLDIALAFPDGSPIGATTVAILVDPFGVLFDSGDGTAVSAGRVTLIDADSGAPATVYGDDGRSAYPSTVVAGEAVTDSSGRRYLPSPGLYRFPFVKPGRYRLKVEPPAPYRFPSHATAAQLGGLVRAGGGFALSDASYGGVFLIDRPQPVEADVPLDRPGAPLVLAKTASAPLAAPGEAVQYRIAITNPDRTRGTGPISLSDIMPPQLRYRTGTMRYAGQPIIASPSPDGRRLNLLLPPLPAGGTGELSYIAEVRADAPPGDALNRASATDDRGSSSNVASALVRIRSDRIDQRLTITGRLTLGGCGGDPRQAPPLAAVRLMLEDGTYTVSDREGRYHFEGLRPGLHVVQIDPSTLPAGARPVDCARNVRSAGSALSRFVEGLGGQQLRADFHAVEERDVAAASAALVPGTDPLPAFASDPVTAGADRDWLAEPSPAPIAWLFPAPDHNPRSRAVRVAIRHPAGSRVELAIGGKPVDPLAFDGTRTSADGRSAVDVWRGVPLEVGDNRLDARVTGADGRLIEALSRNVHYASPPVHIDYLPQLSHLVADGVHRPRIALRLTDRAGRPVQHGSAGPFAVPAPYEPAVEVDAAQARQLSGLERAKPVWRVRGDEGIAYIELAPTTASGSLSLEIPLQDGETKAVRRLDLWLDPGDRPWTLVGFAAGSFGFDRLLEGMEATPATDRHRLDGRIALTAKGRISGKWLMTLAYDSGKREEAARFQGTIDPAAYYTVYADSSQQRYDAASIRKLYLRLERPQFYALFGDYQTGLDETQLARYNRAFNGGKAEYRSRRLSLRTFAADAPTSHRHDELQGNGLSGPYALSARDILANSELVALETRGRLQSARVVERRVLTRYIDYDIDYATGLLRFKQPILSRSSDLDPQFIVADYEVNGVGSRAWSGGGHASWTSADDKLRLGASAISDATGGARAELIGADLRLRPSETTELRAEVAASRGAVANPGASTGGNGHAWLVEAEHHGARADLLAYAREQSGSFGLGQLGLVNAGTRKLGFESRTRLNGRVSIAASAWQEDALDSLARRRAAELLLEVKRLTSSFRAGLVHADDRLATGEHNRSTLLRLGATHSLMNGRLELDGQADIALANDNASVDFPNRYAATARFAVTPGVRLTGGMEVADGRTVRARTARLGFDVAPWQGARILASANRQDIADYGPRTYGAFGLAQSLQLGRHWSLDASLDANRTLGGIRAADVVNRYHPVATGGYVGNLLNPSVSEDFVALTAGATYRGQRWSWASRAEYRAGDRSTRWGLTSGLIRQLGEGRALGGQLAYTHARAANGGPATDSLAVEGSWAHRPAGSRWSILDKIELRDDRVSNAVAGAPGPIGGPPLLVSGNVHSRRAVNSLSLNWSPLADGGAGRGWSERGEVALFWGLRYASDVFGPDEVRGFSNVVGLDLRYDLAERVAVGGRGTLRIGTGARTIGWAAGPTLSFVPKQNMALTLGYNVAGFDDRDFTAARQTRSGPFLAFRLKFDQTSLASVGLR